MESKNENDAQGNEANVTNQGANEPPHQAQQTQPPQPAPTATPEPSTATISPAVGETTAPTSNKPIIDQNDMGFLNDVSIALTIEIGRTQIKIRDLLNLTKDSIIDLNKTSGEPVDIYANGKMISRGHIITANGKYCVRLTSIAPPVTDKAD